MTTFYTSRSAIIEYQRCPRARYLGYEWSGTGLAKVRATIPLATGSWTHAGLASMLLDVQAGWQVDVDKAVQVALTGYQEELAARGLDIELGEDGAYVAEEQLALVEGMLRAYAAKGLGELVEKYEVLEVEREDVWTGFSKWTGPTTHLVEDEEVYTHVEPDGHQVDLQARADGLLRERSTGDLYLLSFKTAAGWDARRDGDARHDVQGLSEAAVTERRLVEEWAALHDAGAAYSGTDHTQSTRLSGHLKAKLNATNDPTLRYLADLPDPPRIMGIQMVFLIKGRREQAYEGGPYLTQSSLIRGWQREGVTDREYAWRYKWEGPDTWPDTGRLKGHTLGKGWSKFDAWTANGGVKAWVEMLSRGLVQPEIGMDPLDATYHMPLPYFRQDRDLTSWVRQAQAQERRVMQDSVLVEQVRKDDAPALPELLDNLFPQYRRSCDYPSKCAYQEICFGDESMLVSPMSTGLYQIRVPHHDAEREAAASVGKPKESVGNIGSNHDAVQDAALEG